MADGPMYLNHNATLMCTHGGQVMLFPPPFRSLWIMQSPVVTEPDLLEAVIVGCPQIGPGLVPCTTMVAVLAGLAMEIQIDGEVPVLDSLQALTDGVPPGLVQAIDSGGSNAAPAPFSAMAMTMFTASRSGAAFCPT